MRDPELCEVTGGMLCLCWGGEADGLVDHTPAGVEMHLKAISSLFLGLCLASQRCGAGMKGLGPCL